jgi:hypothetical protein
MSLRRTQRDELSKLRILEFLSNPQVAGFLAEGSGGATKEDMRRVEGVLNLDRTLLEMRQAGLVIRQETSKASKPYVITDAGRRHLEEVRQKAMLLMPVERLGWADAVGGVGHNAIAGFLRCLPEFKGSDEPRIQQVSRALAEAIGLPAPETVRRDTGRPGRL